jgi:hypothetical protein
LGREFGSRFYADPFLTGLSERRIEIHRRLGKSAGLAFAFSTLIAFFDLVAGSNVSYSGLTVQISRDLTPIVGLFAAGAFLQMSSAFIDDQIIHRILIKLGARIGVHTFPLLLVDKAAINLWGEAFTPKYFGPRSGAGQKTWFGIFAIIALICTAAMFLYAPTMIAVAGYQTFADPEARLVAKGLSALSLLIVLWALLMFTLAFLPFRFHPADWDETTNEPTEEFAARMRAELAAEDQQSGPSQK